jgi:hypothetical protein
MDGLGLVHRRRFLTRKLTSAGIWLLLPSLALLAFRSSPWEAWFRARPFNDSYDATFVAAMVGVGLTSLWVLFSWTRHRREANSRALPTYCTWRNAFDLFELFVCASLATLNFSVGAPGSGISWSAAFVGLLAGTAVLRWARRDVAFETPARHTALSRTASAFLVVFALLFVLFPVLQPWSGPPEPFVRWHPFSPPAERIWRGIFLSFALGMVVAALDPGG